MGDILYAKEFFLGYLDNCQGIIKIYGSATGVDTLMKYSPKTINFKYILDSDTTFIH